MSVVRRSLESCSGVPLPAIAALQDSPTVCRTLATFSDGIAGSGEVWPLSFEMLAN